jgi:hypothetical protein
MSFSQISFHKLFLSFASYLIQYAIISEEKYIPPSMGQNHGLLTAKGVSLCDQDINALDTTPQQFVRHCWRNEQSSIDRAVSIFCRGSGSLPKSIERLMTRRTAIVRFSLDVTPSLPV